MAAGKLFHFLGLKEDVPGGKTRKFDWIERRGPEREKVQNPLD